MTVGWSFSGYCGWGERRIGRGLEWKIVAISGAALKFVLDKCVYSNGRSDGSDRWHVCDVGSTSTAVEQACLVWFM